MFNFLKKKKYSIQTNSKGFTVVEMIVVIAIFGVMTGTMMFNYSDFQKTKDFEVFAQEVALEIKQKQKDAMEGKIVHIDPVAKNYPSTYYAGSVEWKPSYGVFMELTGNVWTGAESNTMVYFYDIHSAQATQEFTFDDWTGAPLGSGCDAYDNECLSIAQIGGPQNKRSIRAICDTFITTMADCTERSSITITFRRPYPDAHMYFECVPTDPVGTGCTTNPAQKAQGPVSIVLQDDDVLNVYQVITIYPIGTFSLKTIPRP